MSDAGSGSGVGFGRGRFVTVEGGEGVGKTTLVRGLAEHLTAIGIRAVCTREPGGTPGAEAVRSLVVKGAGERWDPVCEAMLMSAARRDHVQRKILPALGRGEWVVCDRFFDSTLAYQGAGRGAPLDLLRRLHAVAVGGLAPDLTLLLDLPVEEGLGRASERSGIRASEARFESLDLAFHNRVRQAFLSIAKAAPERCAAIDATAPPETVLAQARDMVGSLTRRSVA